MEFETFRFSNRLYCLLLRRSLSPKRGEGSKIKNVGKDHGLHNRQGNAARWAEVLKFFDPHFSTESCHEQKRGRTNCGRMLRRTSTAATFGLAPNVGIGLAR
jgi:hypothetical protein